MNDPRRLERLPCNAILTCTLAHPSGVGLAARPQRTISTVRRTRPRSSIGPRVAQQRMLRTVVRQTPPMRTGQRGISSSTQPQGPGKFPHLGLEGGRAPRVIVTGALGQIGSELIPKLRKSYGAENVLATDVRKASDAFLANGPFRHLDVQNEDRMEQLVVEHRADWLIHNTSLLSFSGEQNPQLALMVNVGGLHNALDVAQKHKLRLFAPSSIAAFGPSTPRVDTPDVCVMRPSTVYGVTKVYLELLGEYYQKKFGVDFRSMRYPGIISPGAPPGGGTTDYAVDIFHQALLKGHYTCFLKADTRLPMMHMEDCLNSTQDLMEAPKDKLKQSVYNITSVSFTPAELAVAIQKHIPSFTIDYKPDARQAIADSWPQSIDDSEARKQWGWRPRLDINAMVKDMLTKLHARFQVEMKGVKLPTLKNI